MTVQDALAARFKGRAAPPQAEPLHVEPPVEPTIETIGKPSVESQPSD